MANHHVIAKVGNDEKYRVLFTDLNIAALAERFVRPYEKGTSFFSGNELIAPNDLRSVQIIRTEQSYEDEREGINRKDQERIDRLNQTDGALVFITLGNYEPKDMAEAGEDVTHTFIKGHPGYKSGKWDPSLKVLAWVGGIVATVAAAGLVKWLGWL